MKTIKVIVILLMLVFSLVPTTMIVSADGGYEPLNGGPNYMGFTEPSKNVTVGATFYSYIYGDISSEIDTIAVDNLTYLPAGILTYSSLSPTLSKGTLLNASNDENYTVTFLRPTTNVSNSAGYANPWLWAWQTITVNNTNATAFNTRWVAASCGIATFTITAGGTALGGIDPGTTKYTQTVYVHPDSTGLFTATAYNTTQINLTWNKGTGADRTVIRCSTVSNPTTPTGGSGVYNDTGTTTPHPGLTPGEHIYYSAWSWNATANLYSIAYQQDDATALVPNSPPTFGTPSPTNSSTGQNLALTWSIPINDPEGDTFAYWLNCSNGNNFSSVLSSNGTKSLSLSGLSYNTTYIVWVNATDSGGSGQWTREWYNFTTKIDTAPNVPTNPSPANGATNVKPDKKKLTCTVTDPDGDSITVQFYWANGTLIGTDTIASGGTAEVAIPTLAETTIYRWYVNASDGILSTLGPAGAPATNWSFITGKITHGGTSPSLLNTLLVTAMFKGVPLQGAIILIYKGIGTQAVNIVATSENGMAILLADGIYTIHVAKAGYQEQTRTITLTQNMAVVFNLQTLQVVDYLLLGGTILLLVIGLYLAYTVVKGKTYLNTSSTQLIAVLLDVAVIVIGLYYFWLMAIAGAALLIAEIIWMRWTK